MWRHFYNVGLYIISFSAFFFVFCLLLCAAMLLKGRRLAERNASGRSAMGAKSSAQAGAAQAAQVAGLLAAGFGRPCTTRSCER